MLDGVASIERLGNNMVMNAELSEYLVRNLEGKDYILLGSKTAEELIPYWAKVAANTGDPYHALGKLITDTPKIVFSNHLRNSKWDNTTLENGDITEKINALKVKNDLLVYGGISFVRSLIGHGLVDEYIILVQPAAGGGGDNIFTEIKDALPLQFKESKVFPGGLVSLNYTNK